MSGYLVQGGVTPDDSVSTAKIQDDAVTLAKLAANSIDSDQYVDGSIDSAHLADDAVTLAKMATGVDGVILTYDASGNPVHVGPGSDGEVLTSTGAGSPPAFEAAGGGATEINGLSDAITNSSGVTIGLGTNALANDNGAGNVNTAVGYAALRDNTSGIRNTAVGYDAHRNGTTGKKNSAVGYYALKEITTGYNNSAVGYYALFYNTTGDYNTGIGSNAGDVTTTGNNNTSIGNFSDPSSNSVSNQVTLGDSSVSSLRCQVQSISSLSDRRDKKDIKELPVGLDFINDLKPVKFVWDMRDGAKKGIQEIGFVAQDLDESQINAGADDYLNLVLKDNPDKLEASYGKLVPILVKAVQELSAEINHLKAKLNT